MNIKPFILMNCVFSNSKIDLINREVDERLENFNGDHEDASNEFNYMHFYLKFKG
jgi:hypothetical protein